MKQDRTFYEIIGVLVVIIISMISMGFYSDNQLEKLNGDWSEYFNETVDEMEINFNKLAIRLDISNNYTRGCIKDFNNLTYELYEAQVYNNELWTELYTRENITWSSCSNPDIEVCDDCDFNVDCSDATSMLPTFGCEHTLKMCSSFDSLEIGDIIFFNNGESNVIHRIVDTQYNGYITRGDNNPFEDIFVVFREDIIAKLHSISG